MPDPIDRKTSELTSPSIFTDIGNSDYLFVAHYDSVNQEYVNWKVSVTELASKVLKNIEYTSDLTTTNKVIINAINEIAQSGGGGGGSGGHTIVNDSGTSLTQRGNLQFKGAYSRDNSTDSTTEVNVIRNMTKAEFDLLSEAEKTGIINVTDVTGGGENEFQPVIYSETERELGVWIDGKPLYEKTIDCGYLPYIDTKSVAHNISNLDTIADAYAIVKQEVTPTKFFILPYTTTLSEYNIQMYIDTTNVVITASSDRTNCYAHTVIRYTKTTDTAGSGQWTPQGVPAVHYSTTEHVVGTWVDGSTIYEKTLAIPSLSVGQNTIQHGISNFGKMINCLATIRYDGDDLCIPYVSTSILQYGLGMSNFNSTRYFIEVGQGFDVSKFSDGYVTIRYTKSSS